MPPIFISTILQSARKENLAHYFPYDVKLGLLAHSRSLLANQKARNAIVGAENLLKRIILFCYMAGFVIATSKINQILRYVWLPEQQDGAILPTRCRVYGPPLRLAL